VYPNRLHVVAGGLVSYGAAFLDQFRGAADYVDRILKGAKPGDLPVRTPSKYEMALNLKTAKALDLYVPPIVLARADEIIECARPEVRADYRKWARLQRDLIYSVPLAPASSTSVSVRDLSDRAPVGSPIRTTVTQAPDLQGPKDSCRLCPYTSRSLQYRSPRWDIDSGLAPQLSRPE